MKTIKFKIHIYEWNIKVIIVNGKKDIPAMIKTFIKFRLPKKYFKNIPYNIKNGDWAGAHYYSQKQRKSLVLIYNCDSIKKTSTILFHELSHVADRILKMTDINDPEAIAYLYGYIAKKVIPEILKLK